MKRHPPACCSLWPLSLLIFAGLAAPAEGQLVLKLSVLDAPVVGSSRAESKSAALTSKTIRLGEPISVRLELVNTGAQPVDIRPSLNPAAGFVSLELSSGDAAFERFTVTRWETADIMVRTRPLAPGAKLVHETFLFGKMDPAFREKYLFDKEGSYKLRAIFGSHDPAVRVESKPVLIKVGAPVPSWEDLKNAGIVELMEGKLRTHRDEAAAMAKVQSVVAQEPQHPLKSWAGEKAKSLSPATKALAP